MDCPFQNSGTPAPDCRSLGEYADFRIPVFMHHLIDGGGKDSTL
jgi:hypothetical protein